MGDTLPSILTALAGVITAGGGAVYLYLKARNQGATSKQLLRRVYDWIEGLMKPEGDLPLIDQMPPRLRADVEDTLSEDRE